MSNYDAYTSYFKSIAEPIHYQSDLSSLVHAAKDKRFVLLGEASHGTAEFYLWRSAITKRIIENQDVTFIAVEGDWPDCYEINRYIKGYDNAGKSAEEVLRKFKRWPTWMWANEEMIDLIEWLKEWNKDLNSGKKIGFYGMDVYSLWESIHAVIDYLTSVDPQAARQAKELYACFEPYAPDTNHYAMSTLYVPQGCEKEAVRVLQNLQKTIHAYPSDPEEKFNILQNAFVASRAEKYYRSMLKGDVESWNNRDRSMVDTLYRLVDWYGASQTAIVWAHNTHIGDASFTDMKDVGMYNVGQILREEIGKDYVFALGCDTYQGTVIAGREWDSPMEVMRIPKAKSNSWEEVLHEIQIPTALLLFFEKSSPLVADWHGQRAIGVVYNPQDEMGNYVPTQLTYRYDGLIFVDNSSALHPLHTHHTIPPEIPETYPSAL